MTRQQWRVADKILRGPFARFLNIALVEARPGWAKLRMTLQEHHLNNRGTVQGGLVVTLADAALTIALNTLLKPGQESTTVELKVNFLRPAQGEELVAEGNVQHKGRRLAVGDMAVRDQAGKLVATGLGTWAIIPAQGGATAS